MLKAFSIEVCGQKLKSNIVQHGWLFFSIHLQLTGLRANRGSRKLDLTGAGILSEVQQREHGKGVEDACKEVIIID